MKQFISKPFSGLPNRANSWPRVLSLDVFDTCITRTCGAPEALYLWLGRQLHEHGILDETPEVFARTRARVERSVWQREGWLDSFVSLCDFYEELVERLSLSPDLIDILVEAELNLERRVLAPVPRALRLVQRAREANVEVAFVSDTYLTEAFVEERLQALGFLESGDYLLVSSAVGCSKASGHLFDKLLDVSKANASQIVHIGDNRESDVVVPRTCGLRAVHQDDGSLNRFERVLDSVQWESEGAGAAFAGASRLARLSTEVADGREDVIRSVAAGVAGPALTAFVLWTLRQAEVDGVQRLYFLARDGQIMAKIAEKLVSHCGVGVEPRYLHVSRWSTNLAATFEISDQEISWVVRDLPNMTATEFLERFGLSWASEKHYIDDVVHAHSRLDNPKIGAELLRRVQSGPLRPLVLDRASHRRRGIVEYFEKQGLLDSTQCGVVDIGGVGSQIRSIYDLVDGLGQKAPFAYLVGLDHPMDAGLEMPVRDPDWLQFTKCYIYDHRRGRGVRKFRGLVTCYQMFCAADHGMTIGYTDGIPVLETSATNVALEKWGLNVLQSTVGSFVDQLEFDSDFIGSGDAYREPVIAAIRAFWYEPTFEEARVWGQFPFEGAEATAEPQPLIEHYTWFRLVRKIADGDFPELGWQRWHEGAVTSCASPLRTFIRIGEAAYRRLDSAQTPIAQVCIDVVRVLLRRG